jgi:hypothetical protein
MDLNDIDLTEAVDAAAKAYVKHHWNHVKENQPDAITMLSIREALLPVISAAAPYILAQIK